MIGISWLSEQMLASQEVLGSMELDSYAKIIAGKEPTIVTKTALRLVLILYIIAWETASIELNWVLQPGFRCCSRHDP
jgi:hypothetical protein